MTETGDPTRWSQGGASAPDGFARLARDGAEPGPSGEQLARMMDAVALRVARPELVEAYRAELGASGAGAGSSAGVSGSLIAKLGGGALALVLGLGGAALWLSRGEPDQHGAQPQTQSPKAVAPGTAGPATEPPTPHGHAHDHDHAHDHAHGPTVSVGELRAADGSDPRTEAGGAPSSRSEASQERARPATGGAVAEDPAAELVLLERAQQALRGDPGRALLLAESHRAQFPRGQFAQEREMLAIEALIDLGRRPAARQRAALFARRHPQSSHLPRLHDLLQRP